MNREYYGSFRGGLITNIQRILDCRTPTYVHAPFVAHDGCMRVCFFYQGFSSRRMIPGCHNDLRGDLVRFEGSRPYPVCAVYLG